MAAAIFIGDMKISAWILQALELVSRTGEEKNGWYPEPGCRISRKALESESMTDERKKDAFETDPGSSHCTAAGGDSVFSEDYRYHSDWE